MIEKENITSIPLLKIVSIFDEVEKVNLIDWNAMSLSTTDENGQPSSRIVLLKKISEEGLFFYTNYNSKKGQEISKNPKVSLNFWWREIKKQIRIEGIINKTSDEESDKYFDSRPLKSRVSAIISNQSSKINSYEELAEKIENYLKEKDESLVKRPPHCGMYVVSPKTIEFWEERPNRTHERLKFELIEENEWVSFLLSP